MFKKTFTNGARRTVFFALAILAPCIQNTAFGQALTMDGQSGIFLQPWADVVPAAPRKFNAPTVSFHAVDAGPVAGDYINVGVEEGYGNWLEFGYTRSNHTDGGDPTISPLFNFEGMNIFNVKAKIVPAGAHKLKYVPAVSIGGVLRTNDPFVVQFVQHKNATNGDIYGVATELFTFGKKFAFLGTGGVRGTNAQKYGYGGNTLGWEARYFAGLAFPIPIKGKIVVAPAFEINQEPRYIKYVPGAHFPTDLIYAVRVSRYPDSKWTFDVGTGHLGATLAPGLNIKVNNAIAIAADYRFGH
ncbi:hypothetical protein [Tunturiibacter lichenicola]|uniref:hypothetical protein n=1 Tax=Tunturiibacter lichenicola TaxID=2051959 RepID=UPI003D9BBB4D